MLQFFRKAQPSASDVHTDAILTNISVAFVQRKTNFIARQVFPIVPVDKQTDKYYIYDQNAWFLDQAKRRAPATESAGSGYTLSTGSYSADVFAIHKDIDNQTRSNSDSPLDPDRDATEWVTQMILLRQEIQWVTDFFATSVWQTDKTPSPTWDDVTSDPIEDIETGKAQILTDTGLEANTLVLGYNTFRQLKKHPDVVDRIKYTSSQTVTPDMLGAMFEIPKVLVAKAVKATNVEAGTAAYAFTHGKAALLVHVAETPSLRTPSAGYIFAWRGVSEGLGEAIGVSSFYIPQLKVDRIEAEFGWDNKVVSKVLGYFFNAAVA